MDPMPSTRSTKQSEAVKDSAVQENRRVDALHESIPRSSFDRNDLPNSPTLTGQDDDLRRRVSNYLASRQIEGFENLEIDADLGNVIISGKLDSYYEKQLALHSCQRVAGVLNLVDKITVGAKANKTQTS